MNTDTHRSPRDKVAIGWNLRTGIKQKRTMGFPTFSVPENARHITFDDVKKFEDDD
ncbi:hypothetical protein KAH27_05880 [bacterium]|nr:hypothetical protein [bacterium]